MKAFTLLFLFFFPLCVISQPGTLDLNFDGDGKVNTNISGMSAVNAQAMEIQSDGKIVTAGDCDDNGHHKFCIARYWPDGSLDNSFGTNGISIAEFIYNIDCNCMAIQSDGKIIAAGWMHASKEIAVIRLDTNGSLDNSFSYDGKVNTLVNGHTGNIYDIALQSDGKIILVGYIDTDSPSWDDALIVRYNPDGTLDNTFGQNGIITTEFGNHWDKYWAAGIQSDGKIVCAGYTYKSGQDDIALARYMPDGSLDTSFATDGKQNIDLGGREEARAIALQFDGKILIGGFYDKDINTDPELLLLRYHPNGRLDSSFSYDGWVHTQIGEYDIIYDLALQPDGKILACGTSRNSSPGNLECFVIRYNMNGSVDYNFGGTGFVKTIYSSGNNNQSFQSILLQSDYRILSGGWAVINSSSEIVMARYLNDLNIGIVDIEPNNIALVYPNPIQSDFTFSYELKSETHVSLYLLNNNGQKVYTYYLDENRTAGQHKERFQIPLSLASGNYYLILESVGRKNSIQIFIP